MISKDYEGKSVHLVCILIKCIFSCDLAKELLYLLLWTLCQSPAMEMKVSSGRVRIVKDPTNLYRIRMCLL